jgi:hypothetical protein
MGEKKAIDFVFFVQLGEVFFTSKLAFIAICAIIMNIQTGRNTTFAPFFL